MNKPGQKPQRTEIIRNRRKKLYLIHGYRSLLIRLLLAAAAGYILLTQIFVITPAKGNDMFPSVKDGDLVVAFSLQPEYAKNDVVIYEVSGVRHLGRIAALDNDIVMLDENGVLVVNGTIQSGEIIYPTYAKEGISYPLQIPQDSLFLLGDYRTQSHDSRDYGPILKKDIKGKVITILRRRGL